MTTCAPCLLIYLSRRDRICFLLTPKGKEMKITTDISNQCFCSLKGYALAAAAVLALVSLSSFAAPFIYVGDAFSGMSVRVIDAATNTETTRINTNGYDEVAIHPSGGIIYATTRSGASNLGSLEVYDVRNNNALLATIPLGVRPNSIVVHPDGNFIYVASRQEQVTHERSPGIISVVDTSTNTVSATIELEPYQRWNGQFQYLAINSAGNILYVGSNSNRTVTAYDTNTLQPVATINVDFEIFDLEIHPSGQYLYAASSEAIKVIDTTTNSVVDSIFVNSGYFTIAVHPDGNTIYTANYGNSSVSVIDVTTNTTTATISTPFPPSLAIHPSGDFVYVTGYNIPGPVEGFVSVIDTANNQIIDTLHIGGLLLSIAVGPMLDPVGGAAAGISAISVTCTNSTSGQSVSIGLGTEKTWDCESSGLQVNSGDAIEMVVTGNAD